MILKLKGNKGKKGGRSGKEQKPHGIRMLWNYNALVAFLFLFLIFATNSAIFFGVVLKNLAADLLHLIYFTCFMAIIFALTYKKSWAYQLIIFAYSVWIANAFVSLIALIGMQDNIMKSFYISTAPLFVFFIFLNGTILWYVYEKKRYFAEKKAKTDLTDMVFCRLAVIFYICVLLFFIYIILHSIVFAANYREVENNLNFTTDYEITAFCSQAELSDVCWMYAVKNFGVNKKISCDNMESYINKYACYRMIQDE